MILLSNISPRTLHSRVHSESRLADRKASRETSSNRHSNCPPRSKDRSSTQDTRGWYNGKTEPFPGDDGDCSSWDQLLSTFVADAQANDMLEGLVFDIWNEPDLEIFWTRSREQWLQLWGRTYHVLRCV
jgi:hypothetical protein